MLCAFARNLRAPFTVKWKAVRSSAVAVRLSVAAGNEQAPVGVGVGVSEADGGPAWMP